MAPSLKIGTWKVAITVIQEFGYKPYSSICCSGVCTTALETNSRSDNERAQQIRQLFVRTRMSSRMFLQINVRKGCRISFHASLSQNLRGRTVLGKVIVLNGEVDLVIRVRELWLLNGFDSTGWVCECRIGVEVWNQLLNGGWKLAWWETGILIYSFHCCFCFNSFLYSRSKNVSSGLV